MRLWHVGRVVRNEVVNVGIILRDEEGVTGFLYVPAYIDDPHAMELSCSLPLVSNAYTEAQLQPYFEGLLPEGAPRRALAERNSVNEDDYLELLGIVGRDCIGDVVIYEHDFEDERDPNIQDEESRTHIMAASYSPVTLQDIDGKLKNNETVAEATSASRLSLTGTQRKIGLTHAPNEPMDKGWFLPVEHAASTHILKVGVSPKYAEFELICMGAASDLGITAAKTSGLYLSQMVVVSERFDREVVEASIPNLPPTVYRLHQEDLDQAFGLKPGSKYAEVKGGSYRAIARLLRERSVSVVEDLEQLARIAVYNFLVGNCDNHLKNLSVLHVGPHMLKLAPAYDILSTTFFETEEGEPKWSRKMGMRLGNATVIDDVAPEDFMLLADDLGIGRKAMSRICAEIRDGVSEAIMSAGERLVSVSEAMPYAAEDLIEDMSSRLAVLRFVQ